MALKPHQQFRQRVFPGLLAPHARHDARRPRHAPEGRAGGAGAAHLRVRLVLSRRRRGGGESVARRWRARSSEEVGRRPHRPGRALRASIATPTPTPAITSPSSSAAPGSGEGRLKLPNREIVASELFPLDALPADTSQGTRARLREVLGRRAAVSRLVGRDQRCGMLVPRKRSRSCGASMIRSGPSGTMRVGLMRSWLK